MLKKNKKENPEVDIAYIVKILWDAKLKIISFTIITTLIAVFYNYMKPNSYAYKSKIYKSQTSVFNRYANLNQILSYNSFSFEVNPDSILEFFFYKANDYTEIFSFLTNDPIVKLKLSNLDGTLKQEALSKYVKSFKVLLQPETEVITVEFKWHDEAEGRKIYENFVKHFLEKVKLGIIDEVTQTNKIINLINQNNLKNIKFEIKGILEYEKKRVAREILLLEDQYRIAKELGIEDYNISDLMPGILGMKGYERGYKAIEKEINILKNTSDEDLIYKSLDYLRMNKNIYNIEMRINENSLIESIKNLEKDNPYDWVNYTTLNMDIENLSMAEKNFILSLIFGLLIGSLYIIILDVVSGSKRTK